MYIIFPVHTQPYYQSMGFNVGDFPIAESYYQRAISIPLFHGMTQDEQHTVCTIMHQVLQ